MKKPYKNNKTRRKQERIRKIAKLTKRRTLEKYPEEEAGNILDYMQHLIPESKEHQQFTLQITARESIEAQRRYLKSQLERIDCYIECYGLQDRMIPNIFRVIASVIQPESKRIAEFTEKYSESQFDWLAVIAGLVWPLNFCGLKIALLFESRCRIIRPDDWSPDNRDAPISKRKLEEVAEASLHLPIFTMYPPDAPQDEIESMKRQLSFKWKECRELAGLEYKYSTDRLDRVKHKPEVIERYKSHKEIALAKDDLNLERIYTQIFEEMKPKVERSAIKYWCQQYEL